MSEVQNGYYTVIHPATSEIVINKSRFIADIFHAESEEEALGKLDEIRSRFPDATHHCYAYYIIENGNVIQRFSDDGEPHGTAGKPILNAIQKQGVRDVLLVVTRYFGGIKLGAGGLIRAYSKAAVQVLEKASRVYMVPGCKGVITLDYSHLSTVEYFLRQKGVRVLECKYGEKVEMTIVTSMKWEDFCRYVEDVCKGKISCRKLGKVYYPQDHH